MGFVGEQEHHRFLKLCPQIEQYIVDAGDLPKVNGRGSGK